LELLDGKPTIEAVSPPDRLLNAEQVAQRLQFSVEEVYRRAGRWPFTHRLGRRTLRFSEAGLNRWLDRRR
jgi:predicted DNA-binding transcriptional regulator AlpA